MNIIEKAIPLTLCESPLPYAYEEVPKLNAQDYKKRLETLWNMPQAADYDHIIIYGDREHFSNIHYFTGYDPRWEESLLLLERGKTPVLLVGNEGIGYAAGLSAEVRIQMYQTLSLMGQPNDERSKNWWISSKTAESTPVPASASSAGKRMTQAASQISIWYPTYRITS